MIKMENWLEKQQQKNWYSFIKRYLMKFQTTILNFLLGTLSVDLNSSTLKWINPTSELCVKQIGNYW